MLLSTLTCSWVGQYPCPKTFGEDLDMWHVIQHAEEAGWIVLHNGTAFCPDHVEGQNLANPKWKVGCYTCTFDEEFDNEDDAKYEYMNHECEPDTWMHDPAQVAAKEARRQAYANQHQPIREAIEESLSRQQEIEEYAQKWLRLYNTIFFWKKKTIT